MRDAIWNNDVAKIEKMITTYGIDVNAKFNKLVSFITTS